MLNRDVLTTETFQHSRISLFSTQPAGQAGAVSVALRVVSSAESSPCFTVGTGEELIGGCEEVDFGGDVRPAVVVIRHCGDLANEWHLFLTGPSTPEAAIHFRG